MKEARLVLVIEPGTAAPNDACLNALEGEFGGLTRTTGFGVWNGSSENVWIVDIAYEATTENDCKLYDIADKYRDQASQEAVYLRYGNGNVQMVTARSCFDNGEFDWNSLVDSLHRPKDDPNDVPEVPCHVEFDSTKPDLDAAE